MTAAALDERARIAAAVAASFDAMVSAAVEAIWAQVPAYGESQDPHLRADVTSHVAAVYRVFLAGLTDDRVPRRADFSVTREQAAHRQSQGISLADFLQAFRIGQLTLWQAVLDAVRDDPAARDAALALVGQIMRLIELGSTVAGEAYVEAQQHQVAEGDRVRRDVIEDLLASRTSFTGRKRAVLQAAALAADTRLVVLSAAPVIATDGTDTAPALAPACRAVANAGRGGSGLAALRQDEIVAVLALPAGGVEAAASDLQRAQAELVTQQLRLAIGVSTVHAGLPEVPQAYAEARVAREALGPRDGVLALPLLSALDYLVLRQGQTARRLIRQEVRRFVAEDMAAGGALVATLLEYANSDLNAKVAAQRLHLHVNTAYYRLERIAERTGCDLRRLSDVMELLIAVRLLGADQAAGSGSQFRDQQTTNFVS